MDFDPDERTRTLADLIEETRLARHLTPAEAAREMGVSSTLISRWRRGIAKRGAGITWDHLVRVADWLRVPVSSIQELAGYPSGSHAELDTLNDPRLSTLIADIAASWPELDDAHRDIAEHTTRTVFTVRPTHRANRRVDGAANRLEQRRREIRTGVDTSEENGLKHRQFAIRNVSNAANHTLEHLLSALGLNRDSRRVPAAA